MSLLLRSVSLAFVVSLLALCDGLRYEYQGHESGHNYPSWATIASQEYTQGSMPGNIWTERPLDLRDHINAVKARHAYHDQQYQYQQQQRQGDVWGRLSGGNQDHQYGPARIPQRSNSWPMDPRSQPHMQYHNQQQQQCMLNPRVDFLMLSTSWLPGLCAAAGKTCIVDAKPRFIVHGLWPSSHSSRELTDCCTPGANKRQQQQHPMNQLNMRAISNLVPFLDQVWISPYDPKGNRGQWAHEWRRHGTCGLHLPYLEDQQGYFKTTLDLFSHLNLQESLGRAYIQPSNTRSYSGTQIIEATKAATNGRRVKLACMSKPGLDYPVLTKIYVCFDPHTLQPIDCPYSKACTGQVFLLNNH